MRALSQHIGETATWRQFISAGGGNPAYGVEETQYFVESVISGLFAPVGVKDIAFMEMMVAGGQFFAGDMNATLIDCQPVGKDEIIWSGVVYRAASDPLPMSLVNRSAYRVILRRGDATG